MLDCEDESKFLNSFPPGGSLEKFSKDRSYCIKVFSFKLLAQGFCSNYERRAQFRKVSLTLSRWSITTSTP